MSAVTDLPSCSCCHVQGIRTCAGGKIIDRLKDRIELLANLSIILLALALGAALLKGYLAKPTPSGNTNSALNRVSLGDKPTLNDVDFTKYEKTLLFALSKVCRFCSESAPFYQRIIREIAQQQNIQCFLLFPHNADEGKKYLNDLNIISDQEKQADFRSLQISGTPTLILADNSGVVTNVWTGKLQANQEEDALTKLRPCRDCD